MSTSWTRRFAAIPFILALAAAFAVTACGGDDDDAPAQATSTPTTAATSDATKAAVQSTASPATQPPRRDAATPAGQDGNRLDGQRLPAEKAAAPGAASATLKNVTITSVKDHEVIIFEFAGDVPGYKVDYVDSATQCGSGAPVTVAGGAIISVRFSPATAHDAAGKTTVSATQVTGPGPMILAAKQTCDFEGVDTWAVGVKSKAPAAVVVTGNRLVLTVGGKQ
jgi:hypothetical protein